MRIKSPDRDFGFTLIELMIVVVIVGFLAALAIPRFMQVSTKSKQSEAKQILKQIYTLQRTYRQSNNSYWGAGVTASAAAPNAFVPLGMDIISSARYTYTINMADASDFLATATCGDLDDDAAVDTWTIDEGGVINNISNDVIN